MTVQYYGILLDGTRLAVASSIGIWLYDAHTGAEVNLLTGHTDRVLSVSFSPDGGTIASGGGYFDATIRLWDAATGAHLRTLTGRTGPVYSVSFSPDGGTIASGGHDATIRLWDAATGAHLRTLTGHTGVVFSVSFSPHGGTIASGSDDATIRLWDVKTGDHLRTLTGHTRRVNSVSFSPDGGTIASGSEKEIRLWDATGTHIRTLTGHTSYVYSVSFSPDGRTIASRGVPMIPIRLWDVGIRGRTPTPSHSLMASRLWSIAWRSVPMDAPSQVRAGAGDNTYPVSGMQQVRGAHLYTLTAWHTSECQ